MDWIVITLYNVEHACDMLKDDHTYSAAHVLQWSLQTSGISQVG